MGVQARMLALFGERMRPQLRRLSNEQERALKALVARHRQLVEMLVAEQNRLGTASPLLHHALRSHIDFLRKELHQLNHELDQFLRARRAPVARRARGGAGAVHHALGRRARTGQPLAPRNRQAGRRGAVGSSKRPLAGPQHDRRWACRSARGALHGYAPCHSLQSYLARLL